MKTYGKQLDPETVERATNHLMEHLKRLESLEYTVHGRWSCIVAALFDEPRVYVGEMKVFKLNECDWVAACQLDEAIEWYLLTTGCTWKEAIDKPVELSLTEKMQRELDNQNEDGSWWVTITLKEQIHYHMKHGHKFPRVIGASEY